MDSQKTFAGVAEETLANSQDTRFKNTVSNIIGKIKGFFEVLYKELRGILGKIWTTLLTVLPWFGKALVAIWDALIKLFRSPPGEYVTFIIFIILVIVGISWLAFSDNSPLRRAGGGGSGGGGGGIDGSGGGINIGGVGDGSGFWFRTNQFLTKLNIDTSFINRFRGANGDAINTVPRSVTKDGRCDGINNIDISSAGSATKMCLNAKLPVTIEWNLDPTNIIEWRSLPTRIQEKLLKQKGGTKVYIPWGVMETPANAMNPFAALNRQVNTLVPLCSKAYYSDGSSAAHLFKNDEETPERCKRAIYENKKYTSKRTDVYEDTRPTTVTPVNRGENKTCTL